MKHTKGEWKIDKEDKRFVWAEDKEGNRFNLKVYCRKGLEKEAEANAQLIASAPELLEALKEITTLAPRDKLKLPYALQVVEIAEKAISKAQGGK